MRYPRRSPRSLLPAAGALVAVLSAGLLAGCSANGSDGVQRAAPGSAQTSLSSGPDGVSYSVQARNVDLALTGATLRLDPASGKASLQFTLDNKGPVTEHLGLVTVDGGQAQLNGGPAAEGLLSTAGIRLDSGTSTAFGAPTDVKDPSIVLPSSADAAVRAAGQKAGGTVPVMLMFGIAGTVQLNVPVRS